MIDAVTQKWVRNKSDELAVETGCRFDEARGHHVLRFAETYLRLYEGECAGQALIPMPWEVEVTMRMFGWVKPSPKFKREVRRFRQACIWVPKKSGKSPSLAWWGLYLLCADGEKGQKVYFGAKDGGQAREIAGKHALEMVLSSAKLKAECDINRSRMQITHLPTRSLLKPISSSDSRAAKAKEGLNGCLLVDEIHVVDREFMSRVSRAGISRSEPLQIEVSTAGNDPESYGRSRYEYGKQVESGGVVDEQFLHIAWEAPQDLRDEDLHADPVKYGKLANPAWGYTIDETEFLADYNRSKSSVTQLAEFKMYRLNIWQQSANPWLNMGDWARCKKDFTENDLEGRECFAALDLAKTRDTTALALIFPEPDGVYRLWVYFWLPEARARELSAVVSYLQWAKDGHLALTLGDVCDYGYVRAKMNEIRKRFKIQKLAFDDTYAEQLVQRLVEEDGWDIDLLVKFPQTLMHFAGPTSAFERFVIDGKLHHPGNKCLTWQVGNTLVRPDVNGNIRPVKQQHGDRRTIDGVVAGIMALDLAIAGNEGSVYDTRGVLTLSADDPKETPEKHKATAEVAQTAPSSQGWWPGDDDD